MNKITFEKRRLKLFRRIISNKILRYGMISTQIFKETIKKNYLENPTTITLFSCEIKLLFGKELRTLKKLFFLKRI